MVSVVVYGVMVPMVPTVSVVVYCAYSVYGTYVSMVPMCLWSYVKELQGDNRHLYEAFISHTDIDYSTEAQTFFNPFYDSVLGNTVPLARPTSLQFSTQKTQEHLSCMLHLTMWLVKQQHLLFTKPRE